jgi:hypothetical protein
VFRASSTFSSLLNSARRDVLKEGDENVARNSSRAEKKKEAKAAANEVMLFLASKNAHHVVCQPSMMFVEG